MKEVLVALRAFFKDRFNLNEDKAEEEAIVESIQKEVNFKGTNLWTLIFAILIASIGLNVNSTAVIIGAMLISPIMGPIMGIGLGIATNDFELMKKGMKNLAIAAIISIITSSFYFSVTPLHDANSELLARTNPSLWDVFIAFLGGLAGIVAGTRRQKSNVIPGVAIATALMPPLCTAGFGLATGQWMYLLGALYLFFINSSFICLATFLIVKHLKFRKKEFTTKELEKKVTRYIWLTVVITTAPSIWLAYRIVQRSIFESNAKQFIQQEFHFTRTQVINRNFILDKPNRIEVLLLGEELAPSTIDSLQLKMPYYGLKDARLTVHQGLNDRQDIDFAQIRASILQDVIKNQQTKEQDSLGSRSNKPALPDLRPELKALYPDLVSYSVGQSIFLQADTAKADTVTLLVARFKNRLSTSNRLKLQQWVKERIKADTVKLVIE
ncbi:MAG: TIGR00341 family protein [Niastella sp.]|nr:TIGR00341 family protein [Niastella sp.]